MSTISLFDARPFFEKALVHGVQHGLLTPARLEALCAEAPKGMVPVSYTHLTLPTILRV